LFLALFCLPLLAAATNLPDQQQPPLTPTSSTWSQEKVSASPHPRFGHLCSHCFRNGIHLQQKALSIPRGQDLPLRQLKDPLFLFLTWTVADYSQILRPLETPSKLTVLTYPIFWCLAISHPFTAGRHPLQDSCIQPTAARRGQFLRRPETPSKFAISNRRRSDEAKFTAIIDPPYVSRTWPTTRPSYGVARPSAVPYTLTYGTQHLLRYWEQGVGTQRYSRYLPTIFLRTPTVVHLTCYNLSIGSRPPHTYLACHNFFHWHQAFHLRQPGTHYSPAESSTTS